jgi:hypothetical protein
MYLAPQSTESLPEQAKESLYRIRNGRVPACHYPKSGHPEIARSRLEHLIYRLSRRNPAQWWVLQHSLCDPTHYHDKSVLCETSKIRTIFPSEINVSLVIYEPIPVSFSDRLNINGIITDTNL